MNAKEAIEIINQVHVEWHKPSEPTEALYDFARGYLKCLEGEEIKALVDALYAIQCITRSNNRELIYYEKQAKESQKLSWEALIIYEKALAQYKKAVNREAVATKDGKK